MNTRIACILIASASLFIPVFAQAQSTNPCPFIWTRNLKAGNNGADVLALQQFLQMNSTTSFYGKLTAAAVLKFQEQYASDILTPTGLTGGTGVVGPATRAKLNALCAAPVVSGSPVSLAAATATVAGNTLTVSTAAQPAATLAPAGAGGVPFTTFTLTAGSADVTVNAIHVERVGAGEDGAFADVTLADQSGNAIGDTEYFNSNHQATFLGPYIVPAGTTATLTVSGDMASDETSYGGEMPALQIDSIDASAPLSGTLPIRGTAQTINNSLVIGGATALLSSYDPGTDTTHYINDMGVRFSGVRITANSVEDLTLTSIAWDQTGTAGSDDISNVQTVVNGVAYPAETDGHTYTSDFLPGIVIPKGQSADIYVRGDLTTTGANRTVEFDIDDSGDLALTGNTYGYGVGISPAGDTAENGSSVFLTSDGTTDGDQGSSFFAGSVTTINPGALISISR